MTGAERMNNSSRHTNTLYQVWSTGRRHGIRVRQGRCVSLTTSLIPATTFLESLEEVWGFDVDKFGPLQGVVCPQNEAARSLNVWDTLTHACLKFD
jgi:hypothetical protein